VIGTDAAQELGRRRVALALSEVRTAERRASIYAKQARQAFLVTSVVFFLWFVSGS
jgi:hypothetical protein